MRSPITSLLAQLGVLTMSVVPVAAFAQTTVPSSPPPAAGLQVSLPQDMSAQAGAEFTLPLTVSQGKGIQSFAISIIYDPAKVTYVKTEEAEDTQGFKFVDGELDAEGGLKERIIGGNSATKIEKDGVAILANVTFTVKNTATGSLAFKLNNPLDDISTATLQDGVVVIGSGAVSSAPEVSSSPVPSEVSSAPIPSEVSTLPSDAELTAPSAVAPETLQETGPMGTLALLALAALLAVGLHRKRAI